MSEHPRITLSFGWSNKLKRLLLRRQRSPYAIACWPGSEEHWALMAAVNVGIDSHLEAVRFTTDKDERDCPRYAISPDTLPVLVRRLLEQEACLESDVEIDPEDLGEWQWSLGSGICETLGIELM